MLKAFLLFSSLMVLACTSSQNAGSVNSANGNPGSRISEPFHCDDLIKADEFEDTARYIPATITSYRLVENCVCLKYQYSGCREGRRVMVWQNTGQEANRPEVLLKLKVEDPGLCEMLLTDSACFSMKQMQFVGNQVLVYLNNRKNNLALNFNDTPTD